MQDPNEPIWNFSIEDLLVVPPEQAALDVKGPFIINLRTAAAPIGMSVIAGFEHLRTYRLSDMEHGRPRFRARLGFFDTRAEADAALAKLRRE